ncbi:MAG: EAL domain-containing protein [Nocardioides sp.]
MSQPHHMKRVERGRDVIGYLAPFVAVAVIGLSSLVIPDDRLHGPEAWLLLGTFLLDLGVIVLVARQPEHTRLDPLPAYLFLVVVALARDLADGTSALNPLVALPIVWLALTGSRRQLYVASALTAAVFFVPLLVVGPPQYPSSDWQAGLVWSTFAAFIAPVLHRVVQQLARETQRVREAHGEIAGIMQGARMTSIVSCDVDGTIRSFSQGAAEMLGYQASDVVGRADLGLFHDPAEVAEAASELGVAPGFPVFAELARRGAPSRTWTYIRSDGRRIHVRLALTELYDEGVVTGYVAVGVDTSTAVAAQRALALSEAQWRVLLEHLPNTVVIVVDENLRITVVAGAGVTGLGLTFAVGDFLWDVVQAHNRPALEELLEEAFAGHDGRMVLMTSAHGAELQTFVTALPADAGVRRAMILAQDVTSERETQRDVLRAEQRAERLFTDAAHGVTVLDTDGVVLRANAALGTILGVAPADLQGRSLPSLSPSEPGTVERFLADLFEEGHGPAQADCSLRDAWDRDIPVSLRGRILRGEEGADDVAVVNVIDVSERRRYQQQLSHMADHDVLTGLGNRRMFDLALERHVDHCERYGPTGALLLLDLDHFKQVNDTLGHGAGDRLLISTAGLLRREVRSTDVVARLGGDEFAVLLTDGDLAAARTVAETIVTGIREYTSTLDGIRRRITASVGVVSFQGAVGHESDVLALADMTMYDAKDAGRDQYVALDEDVSRPPRSGARLQWQSRIEDALANDDFTLHLQPIMDLRTDTIGSAEALLRMRHDGELLRPAYFLYVAERSGLIREVDEWVVRHSIEMLARLRRLQPDFRLEVNLSGSSIGDPEVEQAIVDGLARNAVDPAALILEITETAAVADVEVARAFAERMTALGCKFALDDFGAGFGSFYYLKHLLFDYVKIDGEFVANCHRSRVDRTILHSIAGIARDLGKQTVAEFVSEPEILEVVRAEQVDHAQGYLIGGPRSESEFVATYLAPRKEGLPT